MSNKRIFFLDIIILIFCTYISEPSSKLKKNKNTKKTYSQDQIVPYQKRLQQKMISIWQKYLEEFQICPLIVTNDWYMGIKCPHMGIKCPLVSGQQVTLYPTSGNLTLWTVNQTVGESHAATWCLKGTGTCVDAGIWDHTSENSPKQQHDFAWDG